jgi:hypothetical protein
MPGNISYELDKCEIPCKLLNFISIFIFMHYIRSFSPLQNDFL